MAATILTLGAVPSAQASGCPGNPRALGTSRILTLAPGQIDRIGIIQYARSLPLRDKEVVLTFDDGPLPPFTNRVLEMLAAECVKANYFLVGRMARGYPDLVRRIHADGHVIGTHSQNHPLTFDRMPLSEARREIEQGIASIASALGNAGALAPFFRFPGLKRAPGVESLLRQREISVWSADLTGDDWTNISATEVVRRVMSRLKEQGKGVVLLHDIQPATALALPELLRQLKQGGYRIVQVAPAGYNGPAIAAKPRPPASELTASAAAATGQFVALVPPRPAPANVQTPPAHTATRVAEQQVTAPTPTAAPTRPAAPQAPRPVANVGAQQFAPVPPPFPSSAAPAPIMPVPAKPAASPEPAPPPYVRPAPAAANAPPPYVQQAPVTQPASEPPPAATKPGRPEPEATATAQAPSAPAIEPEAAGVAVVANQTMADPQPQASASTPAPASTAVVAAPPPATSVNQATAPVAIAAPALAPASTGEPNVAPEPSPPETELVIVVPGPTFGSDHESRAAETRPFEPGLKASQGMTASTKIATPPG